jgi:tetratricopeptide (TPR) repeat protein
VLERVTDDAPHFIPAHRLYQDLLVESAADWRVRTRYAALLAENPEDADAHYLAARIEPDRERQAELFEAASELDPMHPWARVGNALVDLRAGDLEEAAGSAYLSSVLAPSLALPWEFLGQMGLSRGDPGAALEWFDEAIARDPRSVRAHLGRASAARDNGDRAGAAVAALSALRLGPGDRRVIAAVTEELAGSAPPSVVRDALDVTTAALGDVAERWPVSLLRARLRLALGDAAGAHAEARSALRTGAGHADVARVSRRASIRAERYAAAVSEFLEGAPAELLRSDNLYGGRWRDLAAVARVAQRRDD